MNNCETPKETVLASAKAIAEAMKDFEIVDSVQTIAQKGGDVGFESYRKKPVEVQAIQWDGELETYEKIKDMMADNQVLVPDTQSIVVSTVEGEMLCNKGDWIIKGLIGEFYPCKDLVFKKTYDPVV